MARTFTRASNHYLEYAGAVVTAAPLTLAAWVKCVDTTNSQDVLMVGDVDANANQFRLNLGGATAGDPVRAVAVNSAGTTGIAVSTTGYTASTWHHACAVFAANNDRRAFVDGGSKGTETSTVTPTAAALDRTAVGRLTQSAPGNYYDGAVAEAAIWDVALTDADVAVLARGVSPLLIRPESLMAYWPLIGRTSPEIDVVGGFGLTVTGAVAANHCRVLMPRGRSRWRGQAAAPAAGGLLLKRRRACA